MPPTPPPRSSSLAQRQPNGHDEGDRDIHVLVTGYGQFGRIVINPSFLICSALPSELTLPSNPPRKIILHKHPTELPVAYDSILALHDNLINPPPGTIPNLPPQGYDFIFHIGVAGPEPRYSLESLARAHTYHQLGNLPAENVTDRYTKRGAPELIRTGWNDDNVLRRWNAAFVAVGDDGAEKPNLRISTDAGLFLCEFITYCSLASRWLDAKDGKALGEERKGKVAFLHVVDQTDEAAIFKGAEVAKAAIAALVSSWEAGARRAEQEAPKLVDQTS